MRINALSMRINAMYMQDARCILPLLPAHLHPIHKCLYKEPFLDMIMTSQWYIITWPALKYVYAPSVLPEGLDYIRGQLELSESGLLHWQIVLHTCRKQRSSFVRKLFPSAHVETTRSAAALAYVHKEDTSVSDTRFEIGQKPMRRNQTNDWEDIWIKAKAGDLINIPADVRIRSYSTLRRIQKDYMVPGALDRQVFVFYGPTGTGKSRRAWDEAGVMAFPKDPCTKFWDGYNSHEHVVIDEFRGSIGISHILRWFDRYPVVIEIKGGALCFTATKIWITSNLHPELWYPDLDPGTKDALMRRLVIEEIV